MKRVIRSAGSMLFENRGTAQTILKNTFWLSVGQIGGRFLRAGIIIYAARVLGAAEYGVFAYAVGLAGFFIIFADIGVSPILTRNAARDLGRSSQYFATAFWIKIALLAGTAALVLLAAPHFSKIEDASSLMPLVALIVVFDNMRDFFNAYFRAQEKMEREAFVALATNGAILIFGFSLLLVSKTSFFITLAYALSAGVGMTIAGIFLRRELLAVISDFNKALVRPILASAWGMAFLSLLGAFTLNVDVIMLGWFGTAESVGLYSAGQRIVQVLYTVPAVLSSAFFPAISRAVARGDVVRQRTLLERGLNALVVLALPLAVGGAVLGEPIMRFLYGEEFVPGATAFQLLAISVLTLFPGTLIGNVVFARDSHKKLAVPIAISSIANIVLNALLIPRFGAAGAAAATVATRAFYDLIGWRIASSMGSFSLFSSLPKVAVAVTAMGITAFLLNAVHLHVLLTITIAGSVYFAILFLLRERTLMNVRAIFGETER